jgi:hypothetical protein
MSSSSSSSLSSSCDSVVAGAGARWMRGREDSGEVMAGAAEEGTGVRGCEEAGRGPMWLSAGSGDGWEWWDPGDGRSGVCAASDRADARERRCDDSAGVMNECAAKTSRADAETEAAEAEPDADAGAAVGGGSAMKSGDAWTVAAPAPALLPAAPLLPGASAGGWEGVMRPRPVSTRARLMGRRLSERDSE